MPGQAPEISPLLLRIWIKNLYVLGKNKKLLRKRFLEIQSIKDIKSQSRKAIISKTQNSKLKTLLNFPGKEKTGSKLKVNTLLEHGQKIKK